MRENIKVLFKMGKKLTKEDLQRKVKFHSKKVKKYGKKIAKIEKEQHRIGFKW